MDAELRRWVVQASERLAAAGVPSPRHDAEVLAAHAHGVERSQLWRVRELDGRFWTYVERRARREPLQHLLGRAWFRRVELAVGPGVFVPRPETEVVAGAAIDEARRLHRPVVVDLCTGSGAIALAVVDECSHAEVHAVELSPDSYAWARRNLAGAGVDLRLGDMADAFAELDGTVDVVVSNPPYIPIGAVVRDPEVAAHDPALALWSGADGLDAIRVVDGVAARLLRPGGLLVVEHADAQGESVPELLRAGAGWRDVRDHLDLAGRPRFATARREP